MGEGSFSTVEANISNYEKLGLDKNVSAKTENSRTIMPSPDDFSYDYYICGESEKDLRLAPKKVLILENKFSFSVEPDSWDFTLFAVEKNLSGVENFKTPQILKKASLIAYSSVDLKRNFIVSFTLSPDTLFTGGYVNFEICLSNDNNSSFWQIPQNFTCTAKIENPTNSTVAQFSNRTPVAASCTFTDGKTKFGSESLSITPGTYKFVFTIFDSGGIRNAEYSDLILIIPTRTCSSSVYIPNLMTKIPDSPSNLRARVIPVSEYSSYGNQEAFIGHENHSLVCFEWTDNAKTETHFNLQIVEIGSNPEIADFENIDINKLVGYNYDDYNDKNYNLFLLGSLKENSQSVYLFLKKSTTYQIRLRAVNGAGYSNWSCYNLYQ